MVELALARPARPPSPPTASPENEWVSPLALLALLRRRWPLIAVFGLLAGSATYAFVKTLPPLYTASGTLAVEMRAVAIQALQGALGSESLGDPMPLVRSEVQELQSRALIQQVTDELHLAADPEFNATLRPPTQGEQARRWLATHLPPAVVAPLAAIGQLPDLSKPVVPPTAAAIESDVVGAVSQKLSVINDDRDLIITVSFSSQRPAVSAAVVNAVIARYLAGKSAAHDSANQQANAALTQQIATVRHEMADLEQRINATRTKYNLVQTRAGSVGQQQLEDLSSALTHAAADRAEAEADYQRAAAMAASGSGTVGALQEREAEAQQRVALLSSTLGPANPRLRSAEAELASARAALGGAAHRAVASLGARAEATRAREADLQHQLAAAEVSANAVAGVQSELTQLQKDADARRSVYQTLLQGEAQTASTLAKEVPGQTGARVVSPAVAPIYPSSPKAKVATVLGLIGGCAFGGVLALVGGGRRRNGFAKPEEVTAETGLATLAVLRRLPARGSLAQAVLAAPNGPEAEALRALRMRLRFAGRAAPRCVLFVSSLAGEGSSSMAAAFARVAAQDGLRVLLIEGDLATPGLSRMLGITPHNGLVAALEGVPDWREQVVRDPRSPLELLLVAGPQPGGGQLLDAMQMQNLLADARDDYTLVVMDGQPVTQATRSMVLAQLADAVVLVVEALATPRTAVRSAAGTMAATARQAPVAALNKAA